MCGARAEAVAYVQSEYSMAGKCRSTYASQVAREHATEAGKAAATPLLIHLTGSARAPPDP